MAADIYVKRNNLYLKGKELFRARKLDKALKLITKSADIGNGTAMYFLAYLYKNGYADGIYIPSDKEKAFYWMKKTADEGFLGAVYDCAELDPDKNNWIYWMEKGAKMGNASAAYDAACYYQDPDGEGHRDLEKAFHLFGIGAEKDHQKCLYEYAQMYRYGTATPKDPEKALFWMEKAALKSDKSFPDAEYEYAKMLFQGEGCTRDLEKSWIRMDHVARSYKYKDSEELSKKYFFAYQEELAESGDGEAQYQLGNCYYNGSGTEQDYVAAAYWYEKASKQIYTKPKLIQYISFPDIYEEKLKTISNTTQDLETMNLAQKCLADSYYEGKGVEQCYVKAFFWYKMAAALGNRDARSMVDEAEEKLCNLNKEVVEKIYEDCIVNEIDLDTEEKQQLFVIKESGLPDSDRTVSFNRVKITLYTRVINYWFGLLKIFHSNDLRLMTADDASKDYTDKTWTEDHDTVMKLLLLGAANDSISHFYVIREKKVVAKKNPLIIPAYYTDDPKYPEWYEKDYKINHILLMSFFTVFGSIYTPSIKNQRETNLGGLDTDYDKTKSVLSFFFYQPPESREDIAGELREKLMETAGISYQIREEQFEIISDMVKKAETYDSRIEDVQLSAVEEWNDRFEVGLLVDLDQQEERILNRIRREMVYDEEKLIKIIKLIYHVSE